MKYILWIAIAMGLATSSTSFAAAPPAENKKVKGRDFKALAMQEDDVTFSYASMDGEFTLKCVHYFDSPELHDFTVWCGKGTKYLRTFRVHFLVRQYGNTEQQKSAFEVLYWVIDRDQDMTRKFSSTSSWISFRNPSDLERMSFSQGVENDYAALSVQFKPSN